MTAADFDKLCLAVKPLLRPVTSQSWTLPGPLRPGGRRPPRLALRPPARGREGAGFRAWPGLWRLRTTGSPWRGGASCQGTCSSPRGGVRARARHGRGCRCSPPSPWWAVCPGLGPALPARVSFVLSGDCSVSTQGLPTRALGLCTGGRETAEPVLSAPSGRQGSGAGVGTGGTCAGGWQGLPGKATRRRVRRRVTG